MAKGYRLIDKEGVQPFTSLLLFCGIALLISIPAAQRVKDFGRLALLSGVPIYFYVQALFMGILGLNLGATSAKRGEKGGGSSSASEGGSSSRSCSPSLTSCSSGRSTPGGRE